MQSPDTGHNSDKVISDFRISGQFLVKKIVVTPEPVIILAWNLDQQLNTARETKQPPKNLMMTNLKQSTSWIPDA